MAITGYTKLFSSIITSTVWSEDHATRIVWVTMMAVVNKYGIVEGSVPGIAHLAHVTVEECRRAIEKFCAPDPDSRTPDNEGRRLKKVDDGWQMLNHATYKEKMSQDERRAYQTKKQRESRERKRRKKAKVRGRKPVKEVTTSDVRMSTMSTHTDPHTDTDLEDQDQERPRAKRAGGVGGFEDAWQAYPRKHGKAAAMKAWKARKPSLEKVMTALAWQVDRPEWQKEGGQFIPHFSTWINAGQWDDEPFEFAEFNRRRQARTRAKTNDGPVKPDPDIEKTVWGDVLARVEVKVNRFSYFSWFHRTRLHLDAGDYLEVRVPSEMVKEWLMKHYAELVRECLVEVGRPGVDVIYEMAGA